MTKPDILARLDEITRQRAEAQTAVAVAAEGHEQSRRDLATAEKALTAYHAAVGTGERQPNPDTERDLIDAVERIRGRLRPTGERGELEDVAVAARVAGLRKEAAKLVAQERAFIGAHRSAILAALLDTARVQRDAVRAALVALRKAAAAWDAARPSAALAGPLGIDPRDIPSNPLRDAADQLRGKLERAERSPHLLLPFPWNELPDTELGTKRDTVTTPWGTAPNPHYRKPARVNLGF